MARSYKYLLLAAMASLAACTNDGDLGDLYGKWQLVGTESYLNFEGRICQLQIASSDRHELTSVWGGFRYTADSLFISVATADYAAGTTGVDGLTSPQLLQQFFGFTLPADNRLRLQYSLSPDRLILTQGDSQWTFRHYGF